jgi:hypothetical protein
MTGREQQLLDALAGTGWRTPGNLVAAGLLPGGPVSLTGWHQVAASLVRKGWAAKQVILGRMNYSVTREGRRALQVRECPACATPPDGADHTCGR